MRLTPASITLFGRKHHEKIGPVHTEIISMLVVLSDAIW